MRNTRRYRKIQRTVIFQDTDERTHRTGGGVSDGALDLMQWVRKHTRLPLAPGFGMSTQIYAQTCDRTGADAVIAVSTIVERIGHNQENPDVMERELQDHVKGMKRAGQNQTLKHNFR